jgi:hypothetical protein
MMNHLLWDTEEAASALVTKMKTFKIWKITGKDIYKVVSLLAGAINHLTCYIHKLPEDIIKILLQVFQTSLVDNFNATFHLLEKQQKLAVLCMTGAPPDFLPLDIFMLAESEYPDMQTLNKWSGIHKKGASAFNASHSSDGTRHMTQLCFKCRGNHLVKQCSKSHDENWINKSAANFKAWTEHLQPMNASKRRSISRLALGSVGTSLHSWHGLLGKEVKTLLKKLSALLAKKCEKPYTGVCGYANA